MSERRAAPAMVFALALVLALSVRGTARAQALCPGSTTSVLSSQFPQYSNSIANQGVVSGDQYVYLLSYYGFVRVNISNPDFPANPQLAQVGYDRGIAGGGGGQVVITSDDHGGGQAMGVAESSTGDSRIFSNWGPGYGAGSISLPFFAAMGTGPSFSFGQGINASLSFDVYNPLAAIYLPGAGRYFAYVPTAAGYVETFDMSNPNGSPAQSCVIPHFGPCTSVPSQGLQPISSALLWNSGSSSGYGLWAGQAVVGGQTKYILVGTSAGLLKVAFIDPSSGIPTEIGSIAPTTAPVAIAIATVKGGAYIFSAEGASGIQVYEIRGPGNIVRVQQPAAFGDYYTQVVVKAPTPSSPAPIVFAHRQSGGSHIDIYDTNWLTPGSATPSQQPRLGASIPHLGNPILGANVTSNSFGAKVVQNGSTVSAYIFEVVATFPEYSLASTKKDVSCIAADPTAPAAASMQMTNVSAAARLAPENAKNYYGDRWRMQDTSSTGIPLNLLQWDLIAPDASPATIAPDVPNWAMSAPGTVPQTLEFLDGGSGTGTGPGIFWPCDPSAGGDPTTAAGCHSSIGNPSTQQTFNIKILAQNANPPGPTIAAASQLVQAPIVYVNGQTGNPVPAINVLTGQGVLNVLGAPATQGNTSETTFQWTFTGAGPQTGPSVNVSATATAFSLTATYRDGYVAPVVAGPINQTDLVAAFSLQSSTVVTPGSLTVINIMQKAASATLNGVDYLILQGATTISQGTLAASFNVLNGTASVAAPAAIDSYTITLTYRYTGQFGAQTQTPPAQPFATTNWVPAPTLGVFTDAAATIQICPSQFGCNLVINTTYYLKDTEPPPPSGTHPGAQFSFNPGTGFPSPFATTSPPNGQAAVAFTPTVVCLNGCALRVTVQGVNYDTVPPNSLSIASSTQPLSASVNGPTNGSVGVPVSFSAGVTGGVPPYSYQWACEYAGQFTSFVAGGSSTSCTYPSANTYQVVVKVTDSQSTLSQSAPLSIVIGGGGTGSLAVTVNGPSTAPRSTPVTFTAAASGGSGYTFTWTPGESPFDIPESTGSTPSWTHSFAAATTVTYTVTCTVTSGSSSAQGTKSIQITVNSTPGPSAAYAIVGATQTSPDNYNAESGRSLTFIATEAPANVAATNGYTWDFGDGFPKHTQQVNYSFAGVGAKTVTLTVQGDGVNRIGTATSIIHFNVTPPSFQAMLVPSAEHSAVLQDPNGILKFWATDVSVANPGSAPVTISPAFLSFTATQGLTFDLSTITFDPTQKVTIPGGGQRSWVDIVKLLAGDVANKGTLVLKYEGGNATPLVTARVYFAPAADPLGPASGSALPSFRATSDGQVVTQGTQVSTEQALPGLRGDESYYFRLTLFNSSATGGTFRVSAVDERGVPVSILDPSTGAPSSGIDFAIGPYRAIDWSNDSLGLNDPTRRYVLKAHRTSSAGHLVASAAVRDRLTRDQVLVTSDVPPEFRQNCEGGASPCVNYAVPGASRFLGSTGARWRTGLAVFNPSLSRRGVGIEYHYQDTALATPEQVAKNFLFLDPGQLAFYDDVVAQVFATVGNNLADPSKGTAGILRIVHFADGDTSTAPLIISARNYDDQPTGTVGSQLSVYTGPVSLGPNEPSLLLAGVEADATDGSNPKPRFETILSVFSFDDTQTAVRLTALKSDGTVLGFHDLVLNQPGAGGHFQPRNLNIPDFHAVTNEPVTIKVDVMSGGRIGAYALIRDLVTRDPTYVQAVPQQN